MRNPDEFGVDPTSIPPSQEGRRYSKAPRRESSRPASISP